MPNPEPPCDPLRFSPFLNRLRQLYAAMDAAYDRAAGHYGFHCDGCEENCCLTKFYHHTLMEYYYLLEGIKTLAARRREAVIDRAARVVAESRAAEAAGKTVRVMCPLNEAQRCLVYPWRPMICRLHGISHELRRPDGTVLRGGGCRQFDTQAGGKRPYAFDRTPFYHQMAQLEGAFRRHTGLTRKFKMTVAQMLLADPLNPRTPMDNP